MTLDFSSSFQGSIGFSNIDIVIACVWQANREDCGKRQDLWVVEGGVDCYGIASGRKFREGNSHTPTEEIREWPVTEDDLSCFSYEAYLPLEASKLFLVDYECQILQWRLMGGIKR